MDQVPKRSKLKTFGGEIKGKVSDIIHLGDSLNALNVRIENIDTNVNKLDIDMNKLFNEVGLDRTEMNKLSTEVGFNREQLENASSKINQVEGQQKMVTKAVLKNRKDLSSNFDQLTDLTGKLHQTKLSMQQEKELIKRLADSVQTGQYLDAKTREKSIDGSLSELKKQTLQTKRDEVQKREQQLKIKSENPTKLLTPIEQEELEKLRVASTRKKKSLENRNAARKLMGLEAVSAPSYAGGAKKNKRKKTKRFIKKKTKRNKTKKKTKKKTKRNKR